MGYKFELWKSLDLNHQYNWEYEIQMTSFRDAID